MSERAPSPAGVDLTVKAPFLVRTARRGDLPELLRIEQDCFPEDPFPAALYRDLLRDPQAVILVVEQGKRLGATLALQFRMAPGAFADICHVLSLAVEPGSRGQGIARQLMNVAEELAFQHGAGVLSLEVRRGNQAARRLYESLGYQPLGRLRHYYRDGADALRYMKATARH